MALVQLTVPSPINGRYQLVRPLGSSATGTVYHAIDALQGGRGVALKLFHRAELSDVALDVVGQGVRLLTRLRHPHLVQVYETRLSRDADQPAYFTMELHAGISLHQHLATHGPMPEDEAVALVVELARAVAYLHARGGVHRDIRPRNVMVGGSGTTLLDFGLVRMMARDDALPEGALGSIAPEARRRMPGRAGDLFALGATLYSALTAEPLHFGLDRQQLTEVLADRSRFDAHLASRLERVSHTNLREIIRTSVSFEEVDRHSDALAFIAASTAAIGGGTPLETPGTRAAYVRGVGFVGRESELAALDAWRLSAEGRGRLAVVEGASGLGKTRVLEQVALAASIRGEIVLSAGFSPQPPTTHRGWRDVVAQAVVAAPPSLLERYGGELARFVPEHPELSGFTLPPRRDPRTNAGVQVESISAFLIGFAASAERPVTVVLDDLHFAGDRALEVLSHLLFRQGGPGGARGLRVLCAVGGRSVPLEALLDRLARRRRVQRLELRGFGASELPVYAERVFGPEAVSSELSNALRELGRQVDGNVLQLQERLGWLLARGHVHRNGGSWTIDGALRASYSTPALDQLFHDRVAALGLDDGGLRALRLLAMVGGVTTTTQLAAWVGDVDLAEWSTPLVKADVLRNPSPGVVALAHEALRRHIVGTIAEPESLHAHLADALVESHGSDLDAVSDLLAWHQARSGRPEAAAAARWRAAEVAAEGWEVPRACEHLADMLGQDQLPVDRRLAALIFAARLLRLQEQWFAADSMLREAAELAPGTSPLAVAEVESEWADVLADQGAFESAMTLLRRVALVYKEHDYLPGSIRTLGSAGTVQLGRGRIEQAEACWLKQRRAAIRVGSGSRMLAKIAGNMGSAYSARARWSAALEEYQAQHRLALEVGDLPQAASALGRMGSIQQRLGQVQRALECHRERLVLEERMASRPQIALSWRDLGMAHSHQGAYARAKECFDRQLDIAEGLGQPVAICEALGSLAATLHRLGDLSGAVRLYDRAIAIAVERGLEADEARLAVEQAGVEADRAQWDACAAAAGRAFRVARKIGLQELSVEAQALDLWARFRLADSALERARLRVALEGVGHEAGGDRGRARVSEMLFDLTGDRAHGEVALEAWRQLAYAVPSVEHQRRVREIQVGLGHSLSDHGPPDYAGDWFRVHDTDFEQVAEILRDIGSQRDASEVLLRVVDRTVEFLRADRGFVLTMSDGDLEVVIARSSARTDIDADVSSLSSTVLNKVVASRERRFTPNVLADSDLSAAKSIAAMELRSILCLPLFASPMTAEGELWGVLYVDSRSGTDEQRFKGDNLRHVQALADQAAIALAHARQNEGMRESLDQMQTEVTQQMEALRREVAIRQRAEAELKAELAARDRLEAELRQARDLAEAATEARSRFLAVMSHEIRTPLHGLLGIAELVLDSQLNRSQAEQVKIMQRSGQALLSLLSDVLDYSKIEAGGVWVSQEPLDIWDLCENVVLFLAPSAAAQDLELDVCIGSEIPPILVGDSERLRQVLLNLLQNAIKFSNSGRISLIAERSDDGNGVVLEVEDQGIGIATEDLDDLFQPFTRVEVSADRRYRGAGLGLAICQKLVEAMGGELGVESTVGVGSTFRVTLPCRTASGEPARAWPRYSGKRVAVCDSNGTRHQHIVSVLRRLCLDVVSVELEWPSGTVDLLIVDADEAHLWTHDVTLVIGATPSETGLGRPVTSARLIEALHELWPGESEDLEIPSVRPAVAETAPAAKGLRVLLVDDDPVNILVARRMLESLGHSVETANDGTEALRAVLESSFELVLMDCEMPVMDGYSATEAIRALPGPKRDLKIVALTAATDEASYRRSTLAGMNARLTKPFQRGQLAAVIQRVMADAGDTRP